MTTYDLLMIYLWYLCFTYKLLMVLMMHIKFTYSTYDLLLLIMIYLWFLMIYLWFTYSTYDLLMQWMSNLCYLCFTYDLLILLIIYFIWKPLKCFSWYIPGIYQVSYTFIIPKPDIYMVYTKNMFSEKNYILIMLNEYMHSVSTF